MPKQSAHNNQATSTFKSIVRGGALLWLALALLALQSGFALDPTTESIDVAADGSCIVVAGEHVPDLVQSEGQITATNGNSLRLLPGTHLKAGTKLKIDISSKACQEEVEQEVARAEEERMIETVVEKKKEIQLSTDLPEGAIRFRPSLPFIPQESNLGQQGLGLTAISSAQAQTFTAPALSVLRKTSISDIHNLLILSRTGHAPSHSWGDQTGTVKILRC